MSNILFNFVNFLHFLMFPEDQFSVKKKKRKYVFIFKTNLIVTHFFSDATHFIINCWIWAQLCDLIIAFAY